MFIINCMDWKQRITMLLNVYRVTFLYSDAGNGGVSFASSIRNQSMVSCDIDEDEEG